MSQLPAALLTAVHTRPTWRDRQTRWGDVLTLVEAELAVRVPEGHAALLAEVDAALKPWSIVERQLPLEWESIARMDAQASPLSLCRMWTLGAESPAFKDPELLAGLLQRPELAGLLRLALSGVSPRAAHLDALAAHRPASITTLLIQDCALGLAGARALCERPGLFVGLDGLVLPNNKLNAEAAQALAECPHLAGLSELNLRENPIGVEGRIALGRSPHLSDAAKRSAKAIASAQVELAPATEDAREVFGELRSVLQQAPSAHGWARLCDVVARIDPERATHETIPYVEGGLSAWPAAQRPLLAAWKDQIMLGGDVPPAARMARAITLDGVGLNAKVAGRLGAFAAQAGIERLELSAGNPSDKALRALLEAPGFTSLRELAYDYIVDEVMCAQLFMRGPHRFDRLEIRSIVHDSASSKIDALLSSEATDGLRAFGVEYGDGRSASLARLPMASWWWGLEELRVGGGRWDGTMPLAAMFGAASDPVWERLAALRIHQLTAHNAQREERSWFDGDALTARMPALRALRLDRVPREDVFWSWLPSLSWQLEALTLSGVSYDDPSIIAQVDRAAGGALRTLSLSFLSAGHHIRGANTVAPALMRASCWRGLTGLTLTQLGLSDAQLGALIEALPDTLESLVLGSAELGELSARAMASRAWPALRVLSCDDMALAPGTMEILSGASWWGQLEELSLGQYGAEQDSLLGLEELLPVGLRRLSLMDLGEPMLLRALEGGLPPTLESLTLRRMVASKSVVALVKALPDLARLHTLDLEDNSVTAKAVAGFLASPRLLQLPLVKLGTNRLGRPGKQLVLDCPDASIALKSSL
jgi:hypothetical protein